MYTGCFFISGKNTSIFYGIIFEPIWNCMPAMDSPGWPIYVVKVSFAEKMCIIGFGPMTFSANYRLYQNIWRLALKCGKQEN